MIYDLNQQSIRVKINELTNKINKVYLKSKRQADIFKSELDKIKNESIELSSCVETDTMLILKDDSEIVIKQLIDLEQEINNFLKINQESKFNLLEIKEQILEDNSLDSLKKILLDLKNSNPNKLEINDFSEELIMKLLKLLDDGKIKVEDIDYFSEYLDIQLVKNVMFQYKASKLSDKKLENFSLGLDKYNELNDLFNYFLGKIMLPVVYDFTIENQEDKSIYPTTYFSGDSDKVKSQIINLIYKLSYINYGNSFKSFLTASRACANYKKLRDDHYYDFPISFLFTKSSQIIVASDEMIEAIDRDDLFFDDVVGFVRTTGSALESTYKDYKKNYKKFKNLRFLYLIDGKYQLEIDKLKLLEYIYVEQLDGFDSNNLYYFHNKFNLPNLKEIHAKIIYDDGSFSRTYEGNYKIINERKEKEKEKIKKQIKKNF